MAWNEKANLRGPAGYNATGAVEDIATLAAYARQTSGPNAFGSALDGLVGENLRAQLRQVPLTVRHDYDAFMPRPNHPGPVIWQGMVPPRNRVAGDSYYLLDTSPLGYAVESLDLLAWHDASVYGTDETRVYSIADLSGRGHHLDVPGGTGTVSIRQTGINGRPAFRFSGDALLKAAPFAAGEFTAPLTVFIVVQVNDSATTQTFFDGGDEGLRAGLFRSGGGASVPNGNRWGISQGQAQYIEAAASSAPVLLTATFNGGPGTVLQTAAGASTGAVDAGTSWPKRHQLGAAHNGANMFAGHIGEVIMARGVTAADKQAATRYLRAKWSV